MSAAPRSLCALVLLATACQSEPRTFEWFPAMGELHDSTGHIPVPAGSAIGFDSPGDGRSPVRGDEAWYALRFDDGTETLERLLRFRVERDAQSNREKRVTIGVGLFDSAGSEIAHTRAKIHAGHLTNGLFPAALALDREFSREAMPVIAQSIGSMLAVFKVILGNDELAAILWRVAVKPSVLSVVFHLGVHTHISFSSPEHWQNDLPLPAWDVPTYRVPISVSINDQPALDCSFVVVDPVRPVSLGAGILSLVAARPGEPGTRLRMSLVAARRAGSR